MSYSYNKQPLRGLYLIYQALSTLLIRIPLWILLAIPKLVFLGLSPALSNIISLDPTGQEKHGT